MGRIAKKPLGFLLGVSLALAALPALGQGAEVQISGPIAAPDVPGTPSHDYPFFASNHELSARGYVEEEFFIRGTASTYNHTTDALTTATVKDTGLAYVTRIVVRRPADPKRFNGAAIVEWDNVTNMFDAENVWFFDWEHIMRSGYVWVGVSNQTIGIAALKKWSAKRYGALDVGKVTATSPATPGPDADALSYDIFSQIGQRLKNPGSVDPLGGLKPRIFIAAGESQSAGRLSTYVNTVHPLAKVYDGFLLLSASIRLRDDLSAPVFKLSMEHDIVTGGVLARQPDTDKFRHWEVAGTSHVDQHLRASREPLELRDNGVSLEANMAPLCAVAQIGTRTPAGTVVGAAFDHLTAWIGKGALPPKAAQLQITQINPRPQQSVIARDQHQIAKGGIRLAAVEVPTQINFGVGKAAGSDGTAARGEAIGAGACVRWGYSLDMDVATLDRLYPSHAAYVAAVKRAAEANVKSGFILRFDADETIRAAQDSRIGR